MIHSLIALSLLSAGLETPGFRTLQLQNVRPSSGPVGARALATPQVLNFAVVPILFADGDSTYGSQALGRTFMGPGENVSVKDFYAQQSRGAVSFSIRTLPWVRTTMPHSACAANGDYYPCFTRLMRDAGRAAAAAGIDPATLDNDGDKTIDGLIVVFSGTDYQSSGSKDNPYCSRYTAGTNDSMMGTVRLVQALMLPEVEATRILGAGSSSHEIGHLLGLPDIYDDNNETDGMDGGLGAWDLMSNGGTGVRFDYDLNLYVRWKPAGFTAFCTNHLGWTKPIEIDSTRQVRLRPGENARLWTDPYRALQYVLLENRDRSGSDSVLPGPGLLAARIRTHRTLRLAFGVPHGVNSDPKDMGITLLEASGLQRIEKSRAEFPQLQDLFGNGSDSLTDKGPVSLAMQDGTPSGAWVRNIHLDGSDIVFDASPSPLRGYRLATDKDTVKGLSFTAQRMGLVAPLTIPKAGKVKAISSVTYSRAKEVTTSIWTSRNTTAMGTPYYSMVDVGEADRIYTSSWHWLPTPLPVKAGEVIYVGQDALTPDGTNVYLVGQQFTGSTDSAWYYSPGSTTTLTNTYRPAIRIVVETDSGTTSVIGAAGTLPGLSVTSIGRNLHVVGAQPGEAVHVSERDLRGRILWEKSVHADSRGELQVQPGGTGSGTRIFQAASADGRRAEVISLR